MSEAATQTEANPAPTTDPEAVAAELRKRLDDAQRARQMAETRASTAETAAAEARRTAVQNGNVAIQAQADAVSNAVTAGEARMGTLRTAYAAALSAGEYDKVAEINAEMAEVGGHLAGVRQQKAQMEDRRQAALREPQRPAPSAAAPSDPTEAFIATRTPRTAEWLRAHRDVAFKGGELSKKLQAAHLEAEDDGIAPDTDRYFTFIEGKLGMTQPPAASAPAPTGGQRRPGTAPAAPPARSSDYGGGQQQRSGYIHPDVVERAKWMGITPQELQAGIDDTERSGGFLNSNPYARRG